MRWSNQPVRKPARHVADPPEPLAGGPHGRRWVAILGALLLAVSTVAGVAGTSKAAGPTIVSLTFDDGLGSQLAAAQELKAHGLVGTFFITTSFVGQSGFLTQANLNTLVADGNEIGGHSVTHPDMTTLSAAAASAEACNSKSTLEGWGFTVRNFAYPFAAVNQTAQNAVSGCGYSSSRGLGDIRSPASCADCPVAETLPPQEPMVTKAPDQVAATWTLADLQATVTNAETTGGWLQLTFHEIANGTDPSLSISPALFKEFVTWLAARTANGTTSVRTVAQALGQSPVTSPPPHRRLHLHHRRPRRRRRRARLRTFPRTRSSTPKSAGSPRKGFPPAGLKPTAPARIVRRSPSTATPWPPLCTGSPGVRPTHRPAPPRSSM